MASYEFSRYDNPERVKREFVRVDDFIFLNYEKIPGKDMASAKKRLKTLRVSTRAFNEDNFNKLSYLAREREDPILSCLVKTLERFEQKLDKITAILTESTVGQFDFSKSLTPVNISGSGIRFPATEQMEENDNLLIEMSLPSTTVAPIHLIGTVVRCENIQVAEGMPYRLAIKYADIDELDRETIIQHVFKVQREHLRASKVIGQSIERE